MRWHREINQVSGGLALRMTRSSLSRAEVEEWGLALRDVAEEMLNFATHGPATNE